MELVGYAQPWVVRPGQTVAVKVSTTLPEFTAEVVRLDGAGQPPSPAGLPPGVRYPGRHQDLASGSYLIADIDPPPDAQAGGTAQLWLWPTLLRRRQVLLAGHGPDGGWELAASADGRLAFARLTPAGEAAAELVAGPPLAERTWYFAAAAWDATGSVTLVVTRRGRAAPPFPPGDLAAAATQASVAAPVPAAAVLIAGAALAGSGTRRVRDCFNGKIDSPRLFSVPLTVTELTALAADASPARIGGLRHEWRPGPSAVLPPHRVPDVGPARCDGVLVNQPTLGVTGRNWTPGTDGFAPAPDQYCAVHFHEDDLGDAGWDTDLSWEVPAGWDSGVYGIRLTARGPATGTLDVAREDGTGHEDIVPLIVTAAVAPGRRPAAAVLLPTFSYLAYANEHASWEHPIKSSEAEAAAMPVTRRDRFMAEQRLLSLYELHADGSGTCLSSWRRPVLNLRPGYHLPLVRGPHQFSADLELLSWLADRGTEVDVITDDDLHRRGAAALVPYRVVLTGSHPEYTSSQMLDGLEAYLAGGGRLMYLGGNGFYWVTTAPADDPWVIEVRRGMAGTRVWQSPPGECHQAMTGERGGLWRLRGRAPQALAGVGFTAQGFDVSLPYRLHPGVAGGRAAFIVDGLDAAEPLTGNGSVLGGPAGFEIDRADPDLGTPAHAVVVATAHGFSDGYQGAVEDVMTADSRQGGSVSELVRSDIVFFETPGGGAVLSTGSIAWCGALRDPDGRESAVGRLTGNVLDRFADPASFDGSLADG